MLQKGNGVYVLMDETGTRVLPGTIVKRSPSEDGRDYWTVHLNMGETITVHRDDILVRA